MKLLRFCFSSILVASVSLVTSSQASLPEKKPRSFFPKQGDFYTQEETKSFRLRSMRSLKIVNRYGKITLHGWSHDRVQIRFLKKVTAETKESAKSLFEQMGVRYTDQNGRIEITGLYQSGLNLKSKLRENLSQNLQLEIEVFAPSQMSLEVWTKEAQIDVNSWKKSMNLRGYTSRIRVRDSTAGSIRVSCYHCPIVLEKTAGKIRATSQTEAISLSQVKSKSAYLESVEGSVLLEHFQGEALVLTKTGQIAGEKIEGELSFKSESGDTHLKSVQGVISGRSQSGNILAEFQKIELEKKAFLESQTGNIDLRLPQDASFNLDVAAPKNKLHLDYAFKDEKSSEFKKGVQRLEAQIRDGGEDFRVYSLSGSVHIRKSETK